jgi:hypothetical protein
MTLPSFRAYAYLRCMRPCLRWIPLLLSLLTMRAGAAARIHVISFGKWSSVAWFAGSGENDRPVTIKIRALIVDGRVKEYVLATPHEITERLFVVRRVFRVNDGLADDTAPRWQWQRGGWLLVDRSTGRVSAINLPEFDAYYSAASWYRDYAAYCGVSDDGRKIFAVVAQLGRHKAVLKKQFSNDSLPDDAPPDSACLPAQWQRNPTRVSFERAGAKETYSIRGHIVDLVNDAADEDEEASK